MARAEFWNQCRSRTCTLAVFYRIFAGGGQNMTPLLPVIAFCRVCDHCVMQRLSVGIYRNGPQRLLPVGIAVSTAVSSVTTVLMLRMSDGRPCTLCRTGSPGSIWGASWSNVHIFILFALYGAGATSFYKAGQPNVLFLEIRPQPVLGLKFRSSLPFFLESPLECLITLLRCRRRQAVGLVCVLIWRSV